MKDSGAYWPIDINPCNATLPMRLHSEYFIKVLSALIKLRILGLQLRELEFRIPLAAGTRLDS